MPKSLSVTVQANRGYLATMQGAPDVAALDRFAVGPAKPEKGAANHLNATEAYKTRRAFLEQQAKQARAS